VHIKSLEIHGFKSFVERTVFRFQSGITGIVGPNGCGKSNVVDAMRWAMGEQAPRRLRGKNMEDVIFAGAEGHAPVGMAEVVLVFDNADGQAPPAYAAFNEIAVSRRLYRSGESEYQINKVPCRLRDVLDFFRDTGVGTRGYTIVEQGRIAEIVSAKPEERRILLEEAAGISKYKARRREAESKLKATEQNLLRVSDVLGEIRRQISSLERQAKKAARYKRLREEVRLLDLSLARDEQHEHQAELARCDRELAELGQVVTALEANAAAREVAWQQKRLELSERERLLAQGNETLFSLRTGIKELENRVVYEKRERAALLEEGEIKRGEIESLAQQCAALERDLSRAVDELQGVDANSAAAATRLASAEAEARRATLALRDLEREREMANRAFVAALTQIARSEDRLSSLEQRRSQLEHRLRAAEEALELQAAQIAEADLEERALDEKLREILVERDDFMQRQHAALTQQEERQREREQREETARALREQQQALKARLDSLQELGWNALPPAARRVLLEGDAPQRFGLRGFLSDAFEVEAGCEPAVEAVLAERAQALVVETLDAALAAAAVLRTAGAGSACFVPRRRAEVGHSGLVPLGSPLFARVRPKSGFEALVQALFGEVYLVDDLALAVRIYGEGRLPASFVTRDGELLRSDGSLWGGGPPADEAAPRRAAQALEGELERARATAAAAVRAAEAAAAEQIRASEAVEHLRSRYHTAALAAANLEGSLARARDRAKSLRELRERGCEEREVLLQESGSVVEEIARLRGGFEVAQKERLEYQRALDAASVRVSGAGREVSRHEAVVTELRVEHSGRAELRERLLTARDRLERQLAEARGWIERRRQEVAVMEQRCEEIVCSLQEVEQQLARLLREEEAARTSYEEKRDAFEREAAEASEIEADVRRVRGELSERRAALQEVELKRRDRELRLRHLEESVRDRWAVDLAHWEPPVLDSAAMADGVPAVDSAPLVLPSPAMAAEGEDSEPRAVALPRLLERPREERQRLAEEVRCKLEALGEVNLGAIEEHEELQERFRFLSEQKEDLERTVASLREAITRINRTSRQRFRETFEAVNARFQECFPRLFRGGKASLALTEEEEDVLDAGVEIMAQPPGKHLQSVSLLSGGEKTLTALALLMALFQVHPSPFFLLDEVDAALDDANVGRFNELVREMASISQFLLITHNKSTIAIADVLYGVTMERRGVSKLVSVELH